MFDTLDQNDNLDLLPKLTSDMDISGTRAWVALNSDELYALAAHYRMQAEAAAKQRHYSHAALLQERQKELEGWMSTLEREDRNAGEKAGLFLTDPF